MARIKGIDLDFPPIAYGCMNFSTVDTTTERERLVETALDLGVTLFDHADIYGAGESEALFGRVLRDHPDWRHRMIIQTKCGIRFPGDTYGDDWPARYDFSFEHIVNATEGSLRRLGIEQIDCLLLHRPDLLMDVDEVARAFDDLSSAGKVRAFGVSNFDAGQMQLLQSGLGRELVVNQLEISLMHAELIAEGAKVNTEQSFTAAGGTLDYCRRNGINVQAWSPVAGGQLFAAGPDAPRNVRDTAEYATHLAEQKSVSLTAILIAWLLKHPAGIVPVVGTTKIDRLRDAMQATSTALSREEWYGLLEKAQGQPVP